MEHLTFDRLTKLVGQTASRRGGVRAALGALLALGSSQVLTAEPVRARRRHLRAEACIPTGKPCPSKKPRGHNKHGKARTLSCNQCCQRHVTTVGGERQCACQPNGLPCTQTIECCLGVCTSGVCIATTPSPPPPPPPPPTCTAQGGTCASESDCCTGLDCDVHVPNVCCVPAGQPCTASTVCCGFDPVTPGVCDLVAPTPFCSFP